MPLVVEMSNVQRAEKYIFKSLIKINKHNLVNSIPHLDKDFNLNHRQIILYLFVSID